MNSKSRVTGESRLVRNHILPFKTKESKLTIDESILNLLALDIWSFFDYLDLSMVC
jgi:hypothetical protein